MTNHKLPICIVLNNIILYSDTSTHCLNYTVYALLKAKVQLFKHCNILYLTCWQTGTQ